ncbi:MAG: Asp-tRNA(Asn)/Glu-tRNA(Gln) amidotransferase GatCAB subunit C [Deltaproteobacteria bacterium]|nr:MAG: Asp-tRNA(Asn)/Glu-tRNA(Gln) amidotransferase GatCAB subunit C [Deltaproteobacteria bacterium]
MKITKAEVAKVAQLARISIDETEMDALTGQIDAILGYVDQLGEVKTDGVPPTARSLNLTNAFREDTEKGHIGEAAALANAPESEDGYFIVPKVIG